MVNDSKGTFYKNELHCFKKSPYIYTTLVRNFYHPGRKKMKMS